MRCHLLSGRVCKITSLFISLSLLSPFIKYLFNFLVFNIFTCLHTGKGSNIDILYLNKRFIDTATVKRARHCEKSISDFVLHIYLSVSLIVLITFPVSHILFLSFSCSIFQSLHTSLSSYFLPSVFCVCLSLHALNCTKCSNLYLF